MPHIDSCYSYRNDVSLEMEVHVSRATPSDAGDLMLMIKELAEFEKMPEGVKIDIETLTRDLERSAVCGFILRENGIPAAMLLFYYAYSTWQGQVSKELGVERLQWNVLDWNENAIQFYKTMPCKDLTRSEGWLCYRLDSAGIATLASSLNVESN
uniref:N-acetyltransferase domain-containing protein n=1 Tax=Heterorhabditis bacteriophora TaxID=37862 RepID=A0A1I7X603_HETBA